MANNGRFLFGPYWDPLLLGGASIPVMLFLGLVSTSSAAIIVIAFVMMFLAHFVNHPHFAHSYQIFYGSWSDVTSKQMDSSLRKRWWLAGVILPLALAGLLAVGARHWVHGDGRLLAYAITAMGALVGWHYVKQGFGMAMVDAALKKKYWTPAARRALLVNAYVCWAVSWCLLNGFGVGQQLWGVLGIPFKLPSEFVAVIAVLGAGSTCWCGIHVYRCLRKHQESATSWQDLPYAGLLAYFVSLYLWMVFATFVSGFIYFIPFFHSLQYLTVVWRYKRNEINDLKLSENFVKFSVFGFCLGLCGFWLLPGGIDFFVSGKLPELVGYTSVSLACFWLFINVHHYFIDNVLWRQGNKKVNRHLFSR